MDYGGATEYSARGPDASAGGSHSLPGVGSIQTKPANALVHEGTRLGIGHPKRMDRNSQGDGSTANAWSIGCVADRDGRLCFTGDEPCRCHCELHAGQKSTSWSTGPP